MFFAVACGINANIFDTQGGQTNWFSYSCCWYTTAHLCITQSF